MRYSGDSEFIIQDKQCRNIAEKLWAGNYPRNIISYLIDGILCETKWNPDEDIQYMEARLMACELLGKCEVFCYQLDAEI